MLVVDSSEVMIVGDGAVRLVLFFVLAAKIIAKSLGNARQPMVLSSVKSIPSLKLIYHRLLLIIYGCISDYETKVVILATFQLLNFL